MRTAVSLAILAVLVSGLAMGQMAISAKPGMIHYVEGTVLLDGKAVETKFGNYQHMKADSVLVSEDGRAEVLLTPGASLRVGEDSEVSMLTNRLSDVRLKITKGSAILEAIELPEDATISVVCGSSTVTLRKSGLYRFDADPARVMVYQGEAGVVNASDQSQMVKGSRMLALTGAGEVQKFDRDASDTLFRWAKRRAEYASIANISAARRTYRDAFVRGQWVLNPYLGTYTYIPAGGIYESYWGYRYYCPNTVYMVYNPRPSYSGGSGAAASSWNAAGGYHGMTTTSSGTSSVAASGSAASAAAVSAPSATTSAPSVPRGSSSAGGAAK